MTTAHTVFNAGLGLFSVAILVLSVIALFNLPPPAVVQFKTETIVIDGCEYLKFHAYQNDAITHKGNCKNH